MANDDVVAARGGLLPVEYPFGAFRKNYYRLTTSAVAVYLGQPMDMDTNGQVVSASAGTAGTERILGPVIGFAADQAGKPALPSSMLRVDAGPYLPAQTNAYVLIADDPNQIFVIQEATGATQLTSANIGNCGTFQYRTSSGNTTTGYATCELEPIQIAATNSGAIQVIQLTDQLNSDGTYNALGQYAKWKVRIQGHRLGGRVGGTAI